MVLYHKIHPCRHVEIEFLFELLELSFHMRAQILFETLVHFQGYLLHHIDSDQQSNNMEERCGTEDKGRGRAHGRAHGQKRAPCCTTHTLYMASPFPSPSPDSTPAPSPSPHTCTWPLTTFLHPARTPATIPVPVPATAIYPSARTNMPLPAPLPLCSGHCQPLAL